MGALKKNLFSLLAMLTWVKMREYSRGAWSLGGPATEWIIGRCAESNFVAVFFLWVCGKLWVWDFLWPGFLTESKKLEWLLKERKECLKGREPVKPDSTVITHMYVGGQKEPLGFHCNLPEHVILLASPKLDAASCCYSHAFSTMMEFLL